MDTHFDEVVAGAMKLPLKKPSDVLGKL